MSDQGRLVAGRYRLVERVGRGGMGTVWRAEDELLGRQVAVKKLHVPDHSSPDAVRTLYERTRREARSAARISHPHVIVVHDVVEDEGLPCIVMEYVPSVTLDDAVKQRGALPADEVARIGLALTAALRAAHDIGVLHRDIKPANVLLGKDGRIVLTDFGIAMESGTETLTRTGELVGSIAFLAPERLRGLEAGPASDLWSLGVTLYRAVEGRQPFECGIPIETAYAIVSDPHEPPNDAGALTPVIEGLLVKEPEGRLDLPETEHLLRGSVTAGTAVLDAAVLPSRAERPARRGRATGRGRPAALWCGVAVVAASCVAGAALLWFPLSFGDPDDSRGESASAASAPSLPEGYRLEKQYGGLSVPVPVGWARSQLDGGEVAYVDPSGRVGLRVNVAEFAGSEALEHWRTTEEEQTRRDNPGYERVRMTSTTVRGRPGGYWEFTFDGKAREFRAVEVALADDDGTWYVVYLSAPDEEWSRYRPVFDTAVDGLRLPA
ncbi:serine/threonine-protein kinase [Streptomyces sp. SP18CS02]|uniref:serine/threonine-protein kinase n=1 Tax=Streptomyces sp. SP18CS02 TaxID=3002531 RepID=UPI002E77BA99|nr:serine/threonine-protein kinase [Streptomyces sp. SP18CS02]MEE1754457.1 serine/threonine-protein kinase [Streptomyces sp. SP18CS02]